MSGIVRKTGCFVLVLTLGLATGRVASSQDSLSILKNVIEIRGVSGFESPVRDKVRPYLPSWTQPKIDNKGNLLVTFGAGSEHLVFVGHLDEVAYVVTKINEDGTLSVDRPGRFYDRYYEARPVVIYAKRGTVSGIIAPRPNYFPLSPATDGYDVKEARVYLGTENRKDTEDLGIKSGDSITVPKRFVLSGDRATTHSSDDRSGCTAMLLALMRIDPAKVKKKITFAWTVREEVGLEGARAMAEESKADYVFAVDTLDGFDSARNEKSFEYTPPSDGFVIRALDVSGITPPPLVNRVIEIARRNKIPVQTGSANDRAALSRYGTINIPFYSHSPIEVIDRNDLEALSAIIQHLVLEF